MAKADQTDCGSHESVMQTSPENCPGFEGFTNEFLIPQGAIPQENDLLFSQFFQEIGGAH